jgi:predicted Zn-dependent protease
VSRLGQKRREPQSLFVRSDDPSVLLSREQSLAILKRVMDSMAAPDGTLTVDSSMDGLTQFARNQVLGGRDGQAAGITFLERFDRRDAVVDTDQLDDESLRALVVKAETLARSQRVLSVDDHRQGQEVVFRPPGPVNPALWSDNSQSLSATEGRLAAIDTSLSAIQRAGLFGAGLIAFRQKTSSVLNKAGHFEYARTSPCAYSLTARTADATGSGWAYWEGEDWSKCDVGALTERAIDLGQRSRNPVAVEPGRWTVIMTPDACCALVAMIAAAFQGAELDGPDADGGGTIFSKPGGGNKIGLKVMDERVTLSSDPMDPEGGYITFGYATNTGEITQFAPGRVTWVDRGVLKTLANYTPEEAAKRGIEAVVNPEQMRMAGGPTSIEEMIATTERGILVNRISNVMPISPRTLFSTGVTRDGTFLIEKGRITKPVKNMRFEDSPMFFLNNLEAIGPTRRVAGGNVMPPIKVRDFAFTSLTDAV